ncbi:hypothetical protein Tco_0556477 [Tanacetum coccineum]
MRKVYKVLKGKRLSSWSHVKNALVMVMIRDSGSIVGSETFLFVSNFLLVRIDLNKEASVAVKLSAPIDISFRRNARGGIEEHLLADLTSLMDSVTLSNSGDRWVCDLVSDEASLLSRLFVRFVQSARKMFATSSNRCDLAQLVLPVAYARLVGCYRSTIDWSIVPRVAVLDLSIHVPLKVQSYV